MTIGQGQTTVHNLIDAKNWYRHCPFRVDDFFPVLGHMAKSQGQSTDLNPLNMFDSLTNYWNILITCCDRYTWNACVEELKKKYE